MIIPDLPFDEYWICTFQLWKNKEAIYVVLSLAYGTFFPSFTTHPSVQSRSRRRRLGLAYHHIFRETS